MLSGWWQARRKSLLMVRTSTCWWHLTSSTMHHVKHSCTPCCVLDIMTGSCLSQVAWNCSPCNNHCHGWLKNTLSYFWPGEYKKKSCKNRVPNLKFLVFFIHHSQAASPGAALWGFDMRKEKPLLCGRRFARGSLIHTSRCCMSRHRKGAQMSSPSWLSCRRGTGNTAKGAERES